MNNRKPQTANKSSKGRADQSVSSPSERTVIRCVIASVSSKNEPFKEPSLLKSQKSTFLGKRKFCDNNNSSSSNGTSSNNLGSVCDNRDFLPGSAVDRCGTDTKEHANVDIKEEVTLLYNEMRKLIVNLKPLQEVLSKPATGLWLTSKIGNGYIHALNNRNNETISGVPVDSRDFCERIFMRSLDRPGSEGRLDLLCTAAFQGSGKTVMQCFNSYWFATKIGGIAVMPSFNGDQASFMKVANEEDFLPAMALRILHRVYQKLTGDFNATGLADFENGSNFLNFICRMKHPLESTLSVLRLCFSVPEDTPVLLCVDELVKAPADTLDITTKQYLMPKMLQILTTRMDLDHTLYLSITALGAVDIVKISTGWNRHLLLQPLGPLWFSNGLNQSSHDVLPIILQPFFKEDIRSLLPCEELDKKLYGNISQLLLEAAGHGRRVEILFKELTASGENITVPRNHKSALKFVADVHEVLTTERLEEIHLEVSTSVDFPTNMDSFIKSFDEDQKPQALMEAFENLAVDCAQAFKMPQRVEDAGLHATTLLGTTTGHCQLVGNKSKVFHAFIPFVVLSALKAPTLLQPCGIALFQLRKAIAELYQNKRLAGKDWEIVTMQSVLLFARSNPEFILNQLCDSELVGDELNVKLLGGPTVQLWSDIRCFPKKKGTDFTVREIESLVARLNTSCYHGAVFLPTEQFNVPGDWYGLFRTVEGGLVLLCVHNRFWFKDSLKEKGVLKLMKNWNVPAVGTQQTLFKTKGVRGFSSSVTLSDGSNVPIFSILFSANKPQISVQPNEGVSHINSMRSWLPTAAHAMQTAATLREIFTWWDTTEMGEKQEG